MPLWRPAGVTKVLLAFVTFLLIGSLAAAQLPELEQESSALKRAGDILHVALPVTAGLSAAFLKDWEGLVQFGFSMGAASGTVFGIKEVVEKSRPDNANARSFPSGHTQMSFSGAAFIHRRYGPKFGIPALVTAGFVGFSRIRGQKHFADDVLAGASIALVYNFWMVDRRTDSFQIAPVAGAGSFGLQGRVSW